MTYMSRCTRSNSACGVGQHLVGRQAGVQFEFELAAELLAAQPPFARGARQQVLFQEALVVLQAGRHPLGRSLQRVALRGLAREFEQVPLVEGNRALVLADGRLQQGTRRIPEVGFRGRHHAGNLLHAGQDIGDVGLLRQRRLGQQQKDAVAEVLVIDARILLETDACSPPARASWSGRAGGSRSRSGRRARGRA